MTSLIDCPGCACLLKASEPSCPFCATPLRAPEPPPRQRRRLVSWTLGAVMSIGLMSTACEGCPNDKDYWEEEDNDTTGSGVTYAGPDEQWVTEWAPASDSMWAESSDDESPVIDGPDQLVDEDSASLDADEFMRELGVAVDELDDEFDEGEFDEGEFDEGEADEGELDESELDEDELDEDELDEGEADEDVEEDVDEPDEDFEAG